MKTRILRFVDAFLLQTCVSMLCYTSPLSAMAAPKLPPWPDRSVAPLAEGVKIAVFGQTALGNADHLIDQTITGTVVDEKGAVLPGVSIVVKGSQKGTSSDADGRFSINIPTGGTPVLVFSFVGYESQEIPVGNQTSLQVRLKADEKSLTEVVVVGYGTQKKAELTSAVAVVSGEQINKRIATNPTTLLQGQLPGLQVVQNSGEPGNEGVSLRVRGIGTFSGAGNDPLIIVDGIPGSLASLNPNDIASVSVLKDAASAAIYGARGANGVVVITTKNGQSGKLRLSYNYNVGITQATRLPNLITNSVEYMQLSNEARTNVGQSPIYSQSDIERYQNASDRDKYPNHNWLNDVFQTAYVQNHYLNASGGRDQTAYSVSLGVTNQPGVMKGFNYQKYTLQFNLNSAINKFITFGTNTLLRYGKKSGSPQGAGDQFLATLAQTPLYGPKLWDGSGRYTYRALPSESGIGNKNPVAIAENLQAVTDDYYAQLNGYINVNLAKGLKWETRGGLNFYYNKTNDFRPAVNQYYYSDLKQATNLDVGTLGLNIYQNNGAYTVVYSQLNFDRLFGNHHLTILAGAQQEQNMDQYLNAGRLQFSTNNLRELNAGPVSGQTNASNTTRWAIRSFYGRANYDHKNKYLLEVSTRYDGTSRLPDATRWGLFYAVSGGWRLSEEAFLKGNSWLSDLKLRGSWGRLGNQNIGTYPYQSVLSTTAYTFGSLNTGYYAPGLVDAALTWETTQSLDLGVDLAVLNNKLTFTADWFHKKTYDILRSYQGPLFVGLNAPTVNNGTLENTGLEASIQYRNRIGTDFNYGISGNIQSYRNKLTQYGKTEIGGTTIRQEGHPLDEYYLYQVEGIFQSQEEINNAPKHPVAPGPGDLRIKDVNGDGKIDATDRTYTPGSYPAFSYNLNLNASWKNFDVSAQIFGSQGQKLYVTGWGVDPFVQGAMPTTEWRDRWTATNPSANLPRIYFGSAPAITSYASTYYLKDASFVRLKNIQVGYTLPSRLSSKAKLQSVRVYFAGDNLLTLTKFPGLDPERTTRVGSYVSYPQNQVFTFGAMLQF